MKACARERCPPTAVLKAMLAKGSVKFGLGMKLGRMEGAKEARASPRTAPLVASHPSSHPALQLRLLPLAQPHRPVVHTPLPLCPILRRQGGSLPSPRARVAQPGQHTHAASCLRRRPWDRSRCRESSRAARGMDAGFPERGPRLVD